MNPALLTPVGIPRAGLVCWHDLYDPTASLASVPDLSGNGYALQLGSTAGADTNDPAWAAGGKGLVLATDDYAATGNLSGVTMAGEWTVVLALKPLGGFGGYWGFGVGNDNRQTIAANGPSNFVLRSRVSSTIQSGTLRGNASAFQIVAATNASDLITLSLLNTGASVSVVDQNPTGVAFIALGADPVNRVDSAIILGHLFYNCTLSAPELQRIYRSLKATWAARGETIL